MDRQAALSALVKNIADANAEVIVRGSHDIPGPIAAIALFDGRGAGRLAPASISICSSRRRKELAKFGDRWETLWTPSDFDMKTGAADPAPWRDLIATVSDDLKDAVLGPTRLLVRRVAWQLNSHPVIAEMPQTDDFVVFRAAEFPELLEDLRVSTPQERLELLRERRLIPARIDAAGKAEWQ